MVPGNRCHGRNAVIVVDRFCFTRTIILYSNDNTHCTSTIHDPSFDYARASVIVRQRFVAIHDGRSFLVFLIVLSLVYSLLFLRVRVSIASGYPTPSISTPLLPPCIIVCHPTSFPNMTSPEPPTKKAKTSSNLQSLIYSSDPVPKLEVLDQLLIPHEKVYIDVPDVETAWSVIHTMQIRGAPLIAIVALLGLSVDLYTNTATVSALVGMDNDSTKILGLIQQKMAYLKTSRPTAVNLSNALGELDTKLKLAMLLQDTGATPKDKLLKAVKDYSEFMLERDVNDNKAIGKYGAEAILKETGKSKVNLVTICNTGSLATAGYGTALGIARRLQEMDAMESITALETRPYNQGSRLTAFEIMEEKMPGGQLICDSAAGALMQTKQVDAVVVGADRVCANGDTANKIGTYNLSIIAAFHNVPVYVAAPLTSLDITLGSGDQIPIEERKAEELIETSKAPKNVPCWNPAFDVTPAKNIRGIVTEKGVIEPDENGKIDVKAFVEKHTSSS